MTPIIYAGLAADRNDRGLAGAIELGASISRDFGWRPVMVGKRQALTNGGWRRQLEYARPSLAGLAAELARAMDDGEPSLIFAGRCAASIATLPQIASRHPDALLLWFDAHGDCNVPADDASGEAAYLGGMVISAAAGVWHSGFGSGVRWENVILVGSRDLDPPEQQRIASGQIKLVDVGADIGHRLLAAIGDRPVYVHLDCDVLEAGLLATEYQVAGGLDWNDLREAFLALARCKVIGLEIAEFENTWPDGTPSDPEPLRQAIAPLLTAMTTVGSV